MREIIQAAIIERNKILLANNHGNWVLPGGTKDEDDEGDLGTLVREVGEEFSGMQIVVGKLYNTYSAISPRKKTQIEIRVYFSKIKGDYVKPDGTDDDIKEAQWLDYNQASQLNPTCQEILDELRNDGYL